MADDTCCLQLHLASFLTVTTDPIVNIEIRCMPSYFITQKRVYNAPDNDPIVLEKCNFVFDKSLKSHIISFWKKCGNLDLGPKSNNELAHQLFCKCVETVWPTTGHETVEIPRSMTKSLSGPGSPLMSLPTKIILNPISGFIKCAEFFGYLQARKLQEFSRSWSNVSLSWECHNEFMY